MNQLHTRFYSCLRSTVKASINRRKLDISYESISGPKLDNYNSINNHNNKNSRFRYVKRGCKNCNNVSLEIGILLFLNLNYSWTFLAWIVNSDVIIVTTNPVISAIPSDHKSTLLSFFPFLLLNYFFKNYSFIWLTLCS